MMKEPRIRFVEETDLENLIKLCELQANYENSDYDSTNKIDQLYKHLFSETPSLFCLVFEHQDNIIVYATYMRQFSTWDSDFYIYIDCLFLNEKSRGFGLGGRLINRIKQEGEKLQCNYIQWQTPSFNKRAMNFYYRIGLI